MMQTMVMPEKVLTPPDRPVSPYHSYLVMHEQLVRHYMSIIGHSAADYHFFESMLELTMGELEYIKDDAHERLDFMGEMSPLLTGEVDAW